MTAPIVLPQQPGFGDSIQAGLAPLLTMIQHRQQLAMEQARIAEEQKRTQIMAQQANQAGERDAASIAASKAELKQRQEALQEAQNTYEGHNQAAAIYGTLQGLGLKPGTPEWDTQYIQQASKHASKPYLGALTEAFNGLTKAQLDTEHEIASTKLQQAQAAEAEARKKALEAQKVETSTVPQGGSLVVTDKSTGKVLQRIEGNPKPPPVAKIGQVQTAGAGAASLAALRDARKLAAANPNVEREVGSIIASPTFVKALTPLFSEARRSVGAEAIQLFQKSKASPQAQAYFRRKIDFLDNIALTKGYKSRLTGPVLQLLMGEYMPSVDAQGIEAMHQNEQQGILAAITSSGYDDNPETWQKAAKRAGVGDLTPDQILAGDLAGDPQADAILKRLNLR